MVPCLTLQAHHQAQDHHHQQQQQQQQFQRQQQFQQQQQVHLPCVVLLVDPTLHGVWMMPTLTHTATLTYTMKC
jgi:hypothetical protein